MFEVVHRACRNWNFVSNVLTYMLLNMSQNALASTFGEIATILGYTTTENSTLTVLVIVGGICGSIFFGIYLERTKQHIFVIAIGGVIVTCIICVIIDKRWLVLMGIVFFSFGFLLLSIPVVCFDLGVKQLHPLGESYSPTLLSICSGIGSFLMTEVCSLIIESSDW